MGGDPFGLVGQIIDGQYRVDLPIGEGGFSVVYKGYHLGLDEPVAIKCMKLDADVGPSVIESFARRFRDESRLSYRLSQGNLDIVRSIAAGTVAAPATGGLVPYMVLEWLDGISLAADLAARRERRLTGRSLEETIRLLEPAVNAIAYAHGRGVVHRDLKPANLFLARTRDGGIRMRVLDFGLAKILDDAVGFRSSVQTVISTMMVSPAYAAPEQFEPTVGPIGPWTDVYTLGLIVLELLRDRRARETEGVALCAMEAVNPKAQPTCTSLGIKVRPLVEVALARAVAVDIGTRPKDAGEFWTLLKKGAMRGASLATRAWPLPAAAVDHGPTVVDMRPPHGEFTGPGGTLVLPPPTSLPGQSLVVSPVASTVGGQDPPPRLVPQTAAVAPQGASPPRAPSAPVRRSPLPVADRPPASSPPPMVARARTRGGASGPVLIVGSVVLVLLALGGLFALYRFRAVLVRYGVPIPGLAHSH